MGQGLRSIWKKEHSSHWIDWILYFYYCLNYTFVPCGKECIGSCLLTSTVNSWPIDQRTDWISNKACCIRLHGRYYRSKQKNKEICKIRVKLLGWYNHGPIDWWIFPMTGMVALLFALAIVTNQARRAAQSNPVQSLRNE